MAGDAGGAFGAHGGGVGIRERDMGGTDTGLVADRGVDMAERSGIFSSAPRDSWHVLLVARGGVGSLSATIEALSL